MSQQPIAILGAGLAGLVLGRALAMAGRRAVLYQRGPQASRFAYGITLYPATYQPLLNTLDVDYATFRRRVAVDSERGGIGHVIADAASSSNASTSLRASRKKLEEFLREGLDIRWDHQVTGAEVSAEGVKIAFEEQEPLTVRRVIDASGIHSKLRYSLSKEKDPSVLPYVVLNGKRRVPLAQYNNMYAQHFGNATTLEHQLGNGTILSMSIAEYKNDTINLSYTYSRSARNDDELYKPARAMAGAEDIPDAFYAELKGLGELKEPFASMFDATTAKDDRVLHWLMRTTNVSLPELQRLAEAGVCLIGDASHGHPIVGGEGANAAINEGLDLAEWIANKGEDNLAGFLASQHASQEAAVRHSEKTLADLHSTHGKYGTSSL